MSEISKYSPALRVIHWLMALLFAVILGVGVVMTAFKQTEPWTLYNLHKSLGVLVFLLVWLRLAVRWRAPSPPPPPYLSLPLQRIAGAVLILFYALMIIAPISGYALSNLHGYEVKFFGLPLPRLFPANPECEAFSTALHDYVGYGFLGLIVFHLAAVVWHQARGEEVLRRIT